MLVAQTQKTLKKSLGKLAGTRRAIMFSGGFDSMLMASLARRYGARVTAVTVRFDDYNPRTVAQAALLSRRMGIVHHIVHITLSEFVHAHESVVSLIHEPLEDLDLVLVYAALKKYDSRVAGKTFISGMGSDQWFGNDALRWKTKDLQKRLAQATSDLDAHQKVADVFGYKFIFPFLSSSMLRLSQEIPAAFKKDKKLLKEMVTPADMKLLSGFTGRRETQVPAQVRNLLSNICVYRSLKKTRNHFLAC